MAGFDGLDRGTLARIDEIVERAVDQGQAPGVVAGVARGAAELEVVELFSGLCSGWLRMAFCRGSVV